MSRVKLYSPPSGTYDMPYSWIYNLGSTPPDGSDLLNQFVYVQAGQGDFVLRRIAGLSRVLGPYLMGGPPVTAGQYQIYDRYHAPMQGAPIYGWMNNGGNIEQDLGIAPESFYQQTGRIGFDLYGIQRFATSPNSSQIAFQGVRRITGPYMRQPNYRARPRSFIYQMAQIINAPFPAGPFTQRVKITDYDFELYNIMILIDQDSFIINPAEGTVGLIFAASPGVSFTLTINNPAPLANQPFVFTVVPGVSVTVQIQTDAFGDSITTGTDFVNAWNTSPDAVAMASVALYGGLPGDLCPSLAPTVIGPGLFGSPLTDTVAALWIYDNNRVPISSAPMLDIFCDGCPEVPIINGFRSTGPNAGSIYSDGAIVPPLFYQKDSQIQIDFYSQIESQIAPPVTMRVFLIGKQYYPC
jgi:hypothetical protein